MMEVLPNTGIFNNDNLDRLRAQAISDSAKNGLPESVVYYLRVLEDRYLEHIIDQKRHALREIGWKMTPLRDNA